MSLKASIYTHTCLSLSSRLSPPSESFRFFFTKSSCNISYLLSDNFLIIFLRLWWIRYVLPYLQNSHLIGLLVILLCAYVYYPGFPLTELSDDTRNILQKGLLVTFTVNSVLCIQAYIDAKVVYTHTHEHKQKKKRMSLCEAIFSCCRSPHNTTKVQLAREVDWRILRNVLYCFF